jgi:hypothetical protein
LLAASRLKFRPTSLKVISTVIAITAGAAAARSGGSDPTTARAIATAVLAVTPPAQVTHVRCERAAAHVDCGLVVSGTHFHRALDERAWDAEIATLIDGAFAAAPAVDEIDVWATVPADAGHGAVVSGDFAQPTSANVFSITVPRADRHTFRARLASGRGVFWDAAFRASLAKGTRG